MDSCANAFASIVDQCVRHARLDVDVHRAEFGVGCHLANLLDLLNRCVALSTADLAAGSGLTTKLVWGLLKNPRARGQVSFSGGLWALTPDYIPPAQANAVKLLRDAGWHCSPPRRCP